MKRRFPCNSYTDCYYPKFNLLFCLLVFATCLRIYFYSAYFVLIYALSLSPYITYYYYNCGSHNTNSNNYCGTIHYYKSVCEQYMSNWTRTTSVLRVLSWADECLCLLPHHCYLSVDERKNHNGTSK